MATLTQRQRHLIAKDQIAYANELLRAALDILEEAESSPYVRSVLECTTRANGGGDGLCVLGELRDYFEDYDVPRDPQWPQED